MALDAAGHWEGLIEAPGQPLVVMVDLAEADGAWSGTQIDADQNQAAMAAALAAPGNQDVTIRRLAGMNHLFQTAGTGSPAEYARIEETMAPEVLDLIRGWIAERFID